MNDQKILDSEPPKQGNWPDCNQVDSDGKWSHRQPLIRSLADIKRIVELEKELEKQLKPDLFWPENEGELGFDNAHEAIGSMVDDYGATLGSMLTLDRAVKLSSQTYVLTEFDESTGSFEYEPLKVGV
jgi:hypothetical protein